MTNNDVRILSREIVYAILNLIMAISIPSFGGIISRFIPGRDRTAIQTPLPTEQPTISAPFTETERINTIQTLNNTDRGKLTPDQALSLDQEYLNSSVPDHPNSREATTDEIVGSRALGDHNWFAKREAEAKGGTFQEDTPPNLYDTTKEVLPQEPTVEPGEGNI